MLLLLLVLFVAAVTLKFETFIQYLDFPHCFNQRNPDRLSWSQAISEEKTERHGYMKNKIK